MFLFMFIYVYHYLCCFFIYAFILVYLVIQCYANALVENLVFSITQSRGTEIQCNLGVIDNEVNY